MTPQAAAVRSEFPVFSNLPQKAMSTDYKDTVDKVIAKLSTLDDLFSFYWTAQNKVDFQKISIVGLSFIISDCVDELKGINK